MPVKWWLNWRKPSVTYNTTTFQTSASGQLPSHSRSWYTPSDASAGTATANTHASQAWCWPPASTARPAPRTQRRNAATAALP